VYNEDSYMFVCMYSTLNASGTLENYRFLSYNDPEYKLPSLSRNDVQITEGFVIASTDHDVNIKLKRSKTGIELGRALFRSILIKHYFANHKKLGADSLRNNNFYFGNNTKEVELVDRREQPVLYWKKEILPGLLCNDYKYSGQMVSVFLNIIKNNARINTYGSIISQNLITFSDMVNSNFSRDVLVESHKNRRRYKKKVPSLPSESPCLIKEEMSFIEEQFFKPMKIESPGKSWESKVLHIGFLLLKKRYGKRYKLRAEFLLGFSKLTTKRLNEVRKVSNLGRFRKADIKSENLMNALSVRKNPTRSFVSELTPSH